MNTNFVIFLEPAFPKGLLYPHLLMRCRLNCLGLILRGRLAKIIDNILILDPLFFSRAQLNQLPTISSMVCRHDFNCVLEIAILAEFANLC